MSTSSTAKVKRAKRKVSDGIAVISASFNNTKITITSMAGDVLGFSSAGGSGFKGSRKGTPFAAQVAAEELAKRMQDVYHLRRVVAKVSGPGAGRDSAIRALENSGLEVTRLEDITPIPHNGCRPPKKRRV